MDELTKLTNALEHIFLKQIIEGLRHETISIPEAKKAAQDFLATQPYADLIDTQQKMDQFVQQHAQFDKLKEYSDAFHSEQKVDAKIEEMQQHIRNDNLDEALRVAKG